MRIRKYMVFRKHLIVLIKFICYQYGVFSLFRQFSLLKYRILYAVLVLLTYVLCWNILPKCRNYAWFRFFTRKK